MSEFVPPEFSFLPEDELMELEALFERFTAALESEDEQAMQLFFVEEESFFDEASETVNSIFMLTMHQLGLISDEELAAAFVDDGLDACFFDSDFDEFTLDENDDCDTEDNTESGIEL